MNDRQTVARQYQDDGNLSKRIKLHAKHSTSPTAFADWCFAQYSFSENDRILELGCGNGAQWCGRAGNLPAGAMLVLSDLSAGMVEAARQANAGHPRILAQQMDIQAIPYPAESFDRVIANHISHG
ncbi:MAG: class I SAM-dependent methyltransferase [Eubacteriales bacterium]|nr:class I SAM-dependent methyltransferase [Eubacteriales bacterium]